MRIDQRPQEATNRADEPHGHGERRWPWLVAAVVLCPCHLPILLALLGTSALARSRGLVLVALTAAFAVALWRYLAPVKPNHDCPTCAAKGG